MPEAAPAYPGWLSRRQRDKQLKPGLPLGRSLLEDSIPMVLPPEPVTACVRHSRAIPFPFAPAPEQTNAAGQTLSSCSDSVSPGKQFTSCLTTIICSVSVSWNGAGRYFIAADAIS